ncbi:hypothetical protein [Methanomethylovorans sp.]
MAEEKTYSNIFLLHTAKEYVIDVPYKKFHADTLHGRSKDKQ